MCYARMFPNVVFILFMIFGANRNVSHINMRCVSADTHSIIFGVIKTNTTLYSIFTKLYR